ncbi:ulp1 protease family, C-terminal catalytic domain-containing protein [Artemisia annua]|uniref:Ulp1 protease family, C-terminal catalytic domain-containing protein n=1 Tax=Artemisia annua TaxID=35608 RepID=A0A2U1MA40_ARTAN|nr:ulp1 protease family, C-terminal catalytic domain-containing protein [Artemisia annua]
MTDALIENGEDKIKRAKVFDENIKDVLKVTQRKKFRHIDLTAEIDIMDNMYNEIDDISVRYGNVANAIVDSFVDYLRRVKHPSCTKLLTTKPKLVKVPWITKCIGKDSGVFVMRCTETYLGVGSFLCYLKKEEEGLKTELKMLRMKMLTKMILSEINDQREVILKEANVFVKKQKEPFKVVTNDNVNDNQDLLDKITERVKMISQ